MFHHPPVGRIVNHPTFGSTDAYGNNGAFLVESPESGWSLLLILSDQPLAPGETAWEHVSVHVADRKRMRTPTWKEMCYVKEVCWDPEDVVMQLHPARSVYVNLHPHTLHLWRPVGVAIPMPPQEMV